MAKVNIIHRLKRCKNENCNELYIPQPGDKGFCDACSEDWNPYKDQNQTDQKDFLESE